MMNTTLAMSKPLRKLFKRKDLTQREFARKSHVAPTTLNGHVNGSPIPVETLMHYSEVANDSEFNWILSKEMLGLIGIVNGKGIRSEILALGILQKRESDERKTVEEELEINYLLSLPPEKLNEGQRENILSHSSEFADEILFEISRVNKQLEILNMSFMDLMKVKFPEWEEKGWIE
ncbi:helix-turn-helix transcriptional regulator [Enterococcus faecium]|nr:helix-turn-helix transcriptional regulator [Enterococcus faecium]NTK14490.1 helix-turn-helix transcriptional regulator [Enterococcus faecium]